MKRLHLALILLLALLLALSLGWGAAWLYAAKDTVPASTSAGPLQLGGMKLAAAAALLIRYEEALEGRRVSISGSGIADGSLSVSLAGLGYRADTSPARSALKTLEQGSLWSRLRTRLAFADRLDVSSSWNRAAFDRAIDGQWGYLKRNRPVDAKRLITPDNRVVYIPHRDAFRADHDALLAAVRIWAEKGEAAGQRDGGQAGRQAPPDAARGTRLLRELSVPDKLSLKLPLASVHPSVTLQGLKAQGIERLIASFTTDYGFSGPGRVYNVEATAQTLSGWELPPGGVFDYRKIISLTEERSGYREAPVILNGRLSPGVGGGICQVSSTLYNAVLRAGLDIVERRNHSLPVSYLPLGQDATFAEGVINFRFRNTTGYHLLILAETRGRKLTVKLFGTMPGNVRYEIESRTVRTIPPETLEQPSAALPPGGRALLMQGRPGYVVETYRKRIVDGREQSRTLLSRDTYRAQPTIISVGGMDAGSGDGGPNGGEMDGGSAGDGGAGGGRTGPDAGDGGAGSGRGGGGAGDGHDGSGKPLLEDGIERPGGRP